MGFKKIMAGILSVATLTASVSLANAGIDSGILNCISANAEATSGTCGENVTWTLSNDGILTISGTGEMNDWLDGEGYDDETRKQICSPFWASEAIKKIIIEDGVEKIGDFAFIGCSNVIDVELPDTLKSIGVGSFGFCSSMSSISIPDSVSEIQTAAFSCCRALENVKLSSSLSEISENLFEYSGLKTIDIPSNIIKLGEGCFRETKIENIVIPSTVTSIGNNIFFMCKNLKSVKISESTASIGDSFFCGCTLLTSVTLPNTITMIDEYSFAGCENLKDIYYDGTLEEWNKIQINDNNDDINKATIHFSDNTSKLPTEEPTTPSTEPNKPTETIEPTESREKNLIGDLNNDNSIDSKDAVIVLKAYAENLAGNTSNVLIEQGDVNGDGKLDSKDAVKILKYYAQTMVGYNVNIKDV